MKGGCSIVHVRDAVQGAIWGTFGGGLRVGLAIVRAVMSSCNRKQLSGANQDCSRLKSSL